MSTPNVVRYDLNTLLNFIPEDHFFRQKTKKVYKNFYVSPPPQFASSSQSSGTRKKTYLAETEVFSDERAIQEIRGALGKMSNTNKQNIIETLKKNTVSESSYDILVQLLHQYATLCLEWNDLYLMIYDKVYFQTKAPFYHKIFDFAKYLIENPKEYDDPEQKMFFRISNIEIYCKLGMMYPSFRITNILKWSEETLDNIYGLFIRSNLDIEWLILIIHFCTIQYKISSLKEKKQFKTLYRKSTWFDFFNTLVQTDQLPIKIRFKWMDFTDLLDHGSLSS